VATRVFTEGFEQVLDLAQDVFAPTFAVHPAAGVSHRHTQSIHVARQPLGLLKGGRVVNCEFYGLLKGY